MSENERDDGWRPEIVDDESAPLPEPWFLRDLRSRNAQAGTTPAGPERRTLPSQPGLNLGRRYSDPPLMVTVPFWRRWWPLGAGAGAVFVMLILILFVPPRVDGASTPIDIAPETSPTVVASQPPAVDTAALPPHQETADAGDLAPAEPSADRAPTVAPDSSPSFDCADVTSRVNRMICASPQLAALDRQLAARQAEVASQLDAEDRDDLEHSRTEFLGHKLQCDDEDCIARAYDDRMAELDEIADSSERR